ncbi:hypothetical protein GCM10029963_03630 [Micromonospora andamanensis]
MTDTRLMTAADIPLMQDLAQRVTAVRPELISAGASYGELAWVWGQGCAHYRATWPRRLWFAGPELVAWGWAFLPRQVRRNDGSVTEVNGASLTYQIHPDHLNLTDEVIEWYDEVAAGLERTVSPTTAEEYALGRWAAHGYLDDVAALGDAGDWTQLNARDLTDVEQPVLPAGFRFRTADEAGPEAAVQAHVDAWAPRRTPPGATRRCGGPRPTAATCTSWSRHRTGQWPRRRSCGSTRRTGASSSSRSVPILAIGGAGWPAR